MNRAQRFAWISTAIVVVAGALARATPGATTTQHPRNVSVRTTVVRHGVEDVEADTIRVVYTLLRVTGPSGSHARAVPTGSLLTLSYRCSLQARHPSADEIATGCRHEAWAPPCDSARSLLPAGSLTDGGSVVLSLVASARTASATLGWTTGCNGCRNPTEPDLVRGDHLPAGLRAGLDESSPFAASPLTAAEARLSPCTDGMR
ncbi:MAG: hypothetical protein WCJ30_04345 [Deltaproteobacteria bacterium]